MSKPISPTLAILIPTYNGTYFLQRAIAAHCAIISANQFENVEIVVSDNYSHSATAEIAQVFAAKYSFVKYIRQTQHYDTAEGHLFQACASISHDYVWVFGDDDAPRPQALGEILGLIGERRFDAILTNLEAFSVDSASAHPGRSGHRGIIATDEDFIGRIEDIVAAIGFQTVTACFSIAVIKRAKLLASPLEEYMAISPIYSHVAAYLDAFADSTCYYMARPAVEYREGATTIDNWTSFARRRQQSFSYPWTFGLLGLIDKLVARERVSTNFLFSVREHTTGHVFYLWVHVLEKILDLITQAARDLNSALLPDEAILTAMGHQFSLGHSVVPLELFERMRRVVEQLRLIVDGELLRLLPSLKGATATDVVEAVRTSVLRQILDIRQHLPVPRNDQVEWPTASASHYRFGEELLFNHEFTDRFIVEGFSDREPWGRWTDGHTCRLRFLIDPSATDLVVIIRLAMVWAVPHEHCACEISANGSAFRSFSARPEEPLCYVVHNNMLRPNAILDITIRIASPKSVDQAPLYDKRRLGLGFSALSICFSYPD